jgi:hypothetical protein
MFELGFNGDAAIYLILDIKKPLVQSDKNT